MEDLDAADRERNLLKSELHGLARALSPLKKDVSDVLRKQESLQSELNQSSNIDISNELLRIKEDLCSFNAEKAALECEQCDLESRLRTLSEEKEGLRGKLRNLIQVSLFISYCCKFLFIRMSILLFFLLYLPFLYVSCLINTATVLQ